jgi:hypothetical protein
MFNDSSRFTLIGELDGARRTNPSAHIHGRTPRTAHAAKRSHEGFARSLCNALQSGIWPRQWRQRKIFTMTSSLAALTGGRNSDVSRDTYNAAYQPHFMTPDLRSPVVGGMYQMSE